MSRHKQVGPVDVGSMPQFVRVAEKSRPRVTITVDGTTVEALEGDTLLTALLTNGRRVRESEFGHRLGDASRFPRIDEARAARLYVAEAACAGTDRPQEHEGHGTSRKTAAEVRTARFLTHRMQLEPPQTLPESVRTVPCTRLRTTPDGHSRGPLRSVNSRSITHLSA